MKATHNNRPLNLLLETKIHLKLVVSTGAYKDLRHLAEMTPQRSVSAVLALALALFKSIYPAILRGEKVYLVDVSGNSEREIVFPNGD